MNDGDFDGIGDFMSSFSGSNSSLVEDPEAGSYDLDAVLDPERSLELEPAAVAQDRPAGNVRSDSLPARPSAGVEPAQFIYDIDEQAVLQRLHLVPDARRDDFRHIWPHAVGVMRELDELLLNVRAERNEITDAAVAAHRAAALLVTALQAQAAGPGGLVDEVKLAGARVQQRLEQLPEAIDQMVAASVAKHVDPAAADLKRANKLVSVASASLTEVARREKRLAAGEEALERRVRWSFGRRLLFALTGR